MRGYAAFESGDAESARAAFETAREHLYGVEFPYRGDPVLDVQSLFFVAETAIDDYLAGYYGAPPDVLRSIQACRGGSDQA